ncbi:MAG: ATP-binding protein [Fluviicola sp.]
MILTYLKRFYLVVAAIGAAILFASYYSSVTNHDYNAAVNSFQTAFLEEENRLDQVLEFTNTRLNNGEIAPHWENLNGQEGMNIHIYRNDSLIFWNTNQLPIIRFSDIHFPANGLVKLQNGWYYAKVFSDSEFTVCVSFLIRNDYAYENQHLVNNFSPQLPFEYNAEIVPDKDVGFPIKNADGDYVCSIVVAKEQPITEDESVVLLILLLLTVIFVVAVSFQFIVRQKPMWSWGAIAVILALRYLSLEYEWFSILDETEATSPTLYGVNDWLPNFLEYCMHLVVLVFVLAILRVRIDAWKPSKVGLIASYVLPVFLLIPWILLVYFTVVLVENSAITLGINQLFSLNAFSIIALMGYGVLFYAIFHLTASVVRLSKRNNVLGSRSAVIYFAVSCFYLLYEINVGFGLLFPALFPMMYFGAVLYQVVLSKSDRGFGSGLFVLFSFAITMSVTINHLESRKELGEKELYANQLATEKDIVTEVEYSTLAPQLKDDKFLKKLISSPYKIRISDFQENLERRFFNGFWERYEMKFSLFNEQHLPIVDRVEMSTQEYDELQSIVDNSGVPSEIDTSIYFISDYKNQYSYIIRQELKSEDSTAILFCTLKSTKIPEEIGFPRLLISGSTTVFESLDEYSIAKYHDDKLLNKYGDFNYPTNITKIANEDLETPFVDFGGYNHFILRKSPDYTVILSSKNAEQIEQFTAFSYLFSFYGLMLLPLMFRMNRSTASRRTMSLALKIQLVLIALVFLSLLAFGWGSGIFVSNQHKEYTRDVVREKLNSVNKEVGAKLGAMEELDIDENGDRMQFYLEKFSRVFFTDINLYDVNGYLLATSRPKVFNSGLISEQMNPNAYREMRYGERSEYLGDEHIGDLEYSSAYKPFYNKDGKLMAYINLQHFGQQNEFETQIQEFLVAIVNVFVLLLAFSILIAILVSNWLTAPLRILQESFSSVRFGTPNERISYNKEDEIGSLVKDYNQKLEELEYAAQKLARSERESAWREMAKQVAHEIKNPLTPMRLSVQHLLRSYDANDPKSEEKLKRVANSIIEQIDALTNIANEFSNFAKMPRPSEEYLDIIGLIRSAKQVFVSEGISVKVETNLEEVIIRADRSQMIRVFNNLIKNAIQATPEDRSTEVRIIITRTESKIQIDISDNGVGIPAEKKNKIFTPYFTTKSTGTGLGLAMVRQIVENHHGTIDFDSVVDKGTTFTIMLPVANQS